ncbi:MAG TPA: ElyC/SanA/YdcF family protein [Corynebacterium sp.]|nr:ElyC/SanA/YdcF family protein [Corynebacterium sp.]
MRRRRYGRVALALFLLLAGVAGVVGFFLFPSRSQPDPADVVVVLAGADDGRHALARQLVEEGMAENLVVSNPDGTRDKAGSSLCRGELRPVGVPTWCLDPVPVTTTGETQTFDHLAGQEGWQTAVVVTNRPHTHRVRMNFSQCTEVEATVVSIDHVVWEYVWLHVLREIGGFVKHWVTSPC